MEEELITIPSEEDLLNRLSNIDGSSNLQKYFYPTLSRYAERQIPIGLLIITLLLSADSCVGGQERDVTVAQLYRQIPDLLKAIIPDKKAAKRAEEFLQDVLCSIS